MEICGDCGHQFTGPRCPECGEPAREGCVYCGRLVRVGEPSAVNDDAAWRELAGEHHRDCEWVLTRAHRRPVYEASMVTSKPFHLVVSLPSDPGLALVAPEGRNFAVRTPLSGNESLRTVDALLSELGFERINQWGIADFGATALVVRQHPHRIAEHHLRARSQRLGQLARLGLGLALAAGATLIVSTTFTAPSAPASDVSTEAGSGEAPAVPDTPRPAFGLDVDDPADQGAGLGYTPPRIVGETDPPCMEDQFRVERWLGAGFGDPGCINIDDIGDLEVSE